MVRQPRQRPLHSQTRPLLTMPWVHALLLTYFARGKTRVLVNADEVASILASITEPRVEDVSVREREGSRKGTFIKK
jgi:hypothetical protein